MDKAKIDMRPKTSKGPVSALSRSMQENIHLQDTNHKLIKFSTYMLGATTLMLVIAIFAISVTLSRPQKNHFFLVDNDGRVVVEMSPLVNKVQSTAKARTVMDECMRKVFNIDFVHYRQQLLAAEPCFTRNGFASITKLFGANGIIKQLKVDSNVGSLTPLDAPFLDNHGNLRGVYTWVVTGRYMWTLQQGSKKVGYPLTIQATLVEQDISKTINGMAIDSLSVVRE